MRSKLLKIIILAISLTGCASNNNQQNIESSDPFADFVTEIIMCFATFGLVCESYQEEQAYKSCQKNNNNYQLAKTLRSNVASDEKLNKIDPNYVVKHKNKRLEDAKNYENYAKFQCEKYN